LIGWLLAASGRASAAQEPAVADELTRRLAEVCDQIENLTSDVSRREQLTLEMAATFDRAAHAAMDPQTRRHRWSQAIELIDWFLKGNPDSPRERQVRFQAGVYRWAQGRSWSEEAAVVARAPKLQEQAAASFDDAIERYRFVSGGGNSPTLAENLSFRLAEALADRALLEAVGSASRQSREAEALRLLERPTELPAVAGYWHLLKADLLRRSGKAADAQKELDAATSSMPVPPAREIVEVRIPILISEGKFTLAKCSLESSQIDRPVKGLWMVRICLAQLAGSIAAAERFAVESELCQWITELHEGNSPEGRLALLELGRSEIAVDARHPVEAQEALATAYAIADLPAKAGAGMLRAADQAAALGRYESAAACRLKAGGFLYRAGKFQEASTVLSQVSASSAPAPLRAKAGMLGCLARGRALALGLPGASTESYVAALQAQVRDFPEESATDEARWLLGKLALGESDRQSARSIWSAISPGSPRWLESRSAILALDRARLDREALNPDRQRLTEAFEQADHFVTESIAQARSDTDKTSLLLAQARLELTPGAGRPDAARQRCERIARLPASPVAHYQARLYRLVALVELDRHVEAEREALSHSDWRVATEMNALLDAIRLLDQVAATAEIDLRRRRSGLILKEIVDPILASDLPMEPQQESELAMRRTRALLFAGADREARRSLQTWREVPRGPDDRLLRDLGDTYSRLEAYTLEIDVQRLRMKNSVSGSAAWFDARYALALAYFRSDKLKEAARLIDGTAILHPELGGGALHDKFIRLRQRLGATP
jgi:hypothetical protein